MAATEKSVAGRIRRPRQSDTWSKVTLRRMERVAARIAQNSRVDIEVDLPILSLFQRRVILVTQAIGQGQIWFDLPLVLAVSDVIVLPGKGRSGRVVEERRWRREVAEKLRRLKRVRQKITDAREGVGEAALPVRVHADGAKLATEFDSVIAVCPIKIIDERQRVRRIRLTASILRAIGSNQPARHRHPRVRSLTRQH